ncbi:MAG: phosphate acetyltransferase [Candidatus Aminicenantes bacterium]|nr:phosphate acetyltransferase [Candidatus Aminicenantes bacterium]
MSKNLYIATMEPRSGKSVVLLGLMELLSRRIQNIGIFRPIIQAGERKDDYIELALARYKLKFKYEDLYGCTHQEARALLSSGQYESLMKTLVNKYKALERQSDFVVCVGTDYTGVATAFEFDFNADVANQLGCPLLTVVSGEGKTAEDVVAATKVTREAFQDKGCTILATVVNRVKASILDSVARQLEEKKAETGPVYILKEEPALNYPTVGEIARALNGRLLGGEGSGLDREVRLTKVAAMQLTHVLERIGDGDLIITPGDRADVILGSLVTLFSEKGPSLAGLVLTGGMEPEPKILSLIEGLKKPNFPIMLVDTDTFTTATNVNSIVSVIHPASERKIVLALGVFESGVDVAELAERIAVVRSTRVTPIMFEYNLIERAKSDRRHIVLPEGVEDRILRAAEIVLRRNAADLTLLGNMDEIQKKIATLGLDLKRAQIVDPSRSEWLEDFGETFVQLRSHKGVPRDLARDTMLDVSYFGTMMVHKGLADGMVSGSVHTTQHTLRPAFEFIRTKPGYSLISSVFFMCLADRVLVYGDCAVNPNPNPEQLADIAIASAETAKAFGIEPRIAMLSYSTGESGKGEDVEKVREATQIARERRPDLKFEGPIQYDAAIDASVAATKMPKSEVAGQATVFIFPDLNTGNNTYKAVQRSANAVAIGPVIQGLNKPVNDLSRGCTVTDIVNTVVITAIQAQGQRRSA